MRIAHLLRTTASTLALAALVGGFALSASAADNAACDTKTAQNSAGSTINPGPNANVAAGAASQPARPGDPAGSASDRQQMAYSSTKDAQGNTLNPSTGTTVPGTPSYGAASERQQGALSAQDCK
jgi:hypothetical protein